jgi:hypothetical protein
MTLIMAGNPWKISQKNLNPPREDESREKYIVKRLDRKEIASRKS